MRSLLCRFVSVIASGVAPWRSLRERQRVFSRCSPVLSLRAASVPRLDLIGASSLISLVASVASRRPPANRRWA